jgi:hypothetical protein
MNYPTSFSVYKKSAAAQLNLILPRRNEKGCIDKEGAVLIEVAKATGEKQYDWTKKIVFAFGMNDFCMFFDNPENPPRLIHKLDEVVKSLEFKQGEAQYAGTYMMSLSDGQNKISVPLSGGEYQIITRLFSCAIPKIIGWE